VSEEVGLLDGGVDRLSVYTNKATGVSQAVKAILAKVLSLRQQVQSLQSQLGERQAELDAVGVDQDRIRKNMAALDKNDSLYKRYVNELEMQENSLVALRKTMTDLRAKLGTAERDLRAYISDQSTIAK
jgi:chromosome segregation ATPase